MSETTPKAQPSRRTIVKGAAWAAPVIAVAVATPAAAASTTPGPVPNDEANYYWDTAAGTEFATLDPAASGNRAQFSTQISYRSEPWVNPPSAGVLTVTVVFSEVVDVDNINSAWTLQGDASSSTFTFEMSPSSFGSGLTFDAVAAESGELSATATMSVVNPERTDGSLASWAQEPAAVSATLVA